MVKRALRLPTAHRFHLAWRLARSPRVPWRARLPLAALIVYLAMPLDLIPDFIPVIGQLDDLLVAGIAVWWFLRVCPPAVALEEISRLEQTPLGPWGRRLPWLLGGVLVFTFALLIAWMLHRR
ncbi:MAG TPA: YkvA family protein [Dehalococcoidia bacterium]|nr:YkvA family protein [Dehalococcoidia bacterium]